jgi:MipA family protein
MNFLSDHRSGRPASLQFGVASAVLMMSCVSTAWGQLAMPGAAAPPAPEASSATSTTSQWGLGVSVGLQRKPYRDFDNKSQVLPLLFFENRWFSVIGPALDFKLPTAGSLSLRLRARYASEGYEAGDSPYLAGMDERKDGFWLGGVALWRTDLLNVSAELLGDASGHSKGSQFKLQLDRRFQSGAFDFTPRVAAKWLDDKYVDYYYGVRGSEARAGRPVFQGKSAVNAELGLRVGYALTPNQGVFLDASTTRLGNSIKDSPLVDRSTSSALRVGYLYRF